MITRTSLRRKVVWAAIRRGLRDFSHNRLALIGVGIILAYGLAALIYPLLLGTVWETGLYDPTTGFDPDLVHPSAPSAGHLFGTDALGRDVLSQLLSATRATWVMAIVAAFTTAVVATLVGAVSALFRGWVDAVIARVSDAFLLLPAPIFMLVIGSSEVSQNIGPLEFGLIYGAITGIGAGAIVIRAQALKVIAAPFIDAARVAGVRRWRLLTHHVLPHLYPLAAVFMMLSVVGAIVADGFASWLGQTGTRINWGTMVYYGVNFPNPVTGEPVWNAIIPPSLALSIFAAAFYLVSVGLREVADPRYRAARRRLEG
jgi:peptide/nickel transport system permease protein